MIECNETDLLPLYKSLSLLLPASGHGESICICSLLLLAKLLELVVLVAITHLLFEVVFVMDLHEGVAELTGSILQEGEGLLGVHHRVEMTLELGLAITLRVKLVLEVAEELLERV